MYKHHRSLMSPYVEHMDLLSIHQYSLHAPICLLESIPSPVGKHFYGFLEPYIQRSMHVVRLIAFGPHLAGATCTSFHFDISLLALLDSGQGRDASSSSKTSATRNPIPDLLSLRMHATRRIVSPVPTKLDTFPSPSRASARRKQDSKEYSDSSTQLRSYVVFIRCPYMLCRTLFFRIGKSTSAFA